MTDDELLVLALGDPPRAEAAARQVLAESTDARELSVAHQALGIVLRDAGHLDLALTELRSGLGSATATGDAERVADVRATYGVALAMAGRSRAALRQLDAAATIGNGVGAAMVLMRRAYVLSLLGRQGDALLDMRQALAGIRRSGDRIWEARTRHNLGYIEMSLGYVAEAEQDTLVAERIFEEEGQLLEAAWAHQNLGEIAFCRGDLPSALRIYDEAAQACSALGQPRADLAFVRSAAYLAAGMPGEAVEAVALVLSTLRLQPTMRADLELALADAHLASGDPVAALAVATAARAAFHRQEREWFELRAELAQVRARLGQGPSIGLARQARDVAARLDAEQADEAPMALTLAGQLDKDEERAALLRAAREYRNRPNALVRASAWLAGALARESEDDRGGTLRACGRGLDALDEHRQTLGSSELRALATTHGRELAAVALRHAATADARTLLRWSERWRATALAQPPVTPGDEVPAALAALRDNGRRLAEARTEGEPTDQLEQERKRLEREVRAEHHRTAGQGQSDPRLDVEQLVAEVGDAALVELVDVDGTLHVIVVTGGRVRRRVAGSTEQARELTELAGFVLRRAARGRRFDPGDLGTRLQETLLGPAVRLLPDGPVVVAPTARLHGTPWALLPVLVGRPFSVVPSAAQWLRARAATTSNDAKVVLLAGPGLRTGGAEVPLLAARHPDAVLLDGKKATVEAAMAALDGAGLAHVAAHGHFRADSPLFSSLDMADGPLTVHDLERLRVAPHRLVLSACESGVLAPVGADELLGLASALFAIGTAGLVSSVAEVNDEVTAGLMVDLHDRLVQGGGLADALLAARQAASGDPAREATAAAFLALGV